MIKSSNNIKTRGSSANLLCHKNVKEKIGKLGLKSATLNKRTKQNVSRNVEATQIIKDSKKIKRKEKNMKLSEYIVEKVAVTNTLQKKNIRTFENVSFTVSKNHVDNNADLASPNEKNDKMTRHGLKRKRLLNDSTESNKNNVSTENIIEKTINPRLTLRKRRKVNNNKQSTDSLNLNELSKEHILQCISAIFHLTEEQLKTKNALFEGESHPVFIQVTCIRVPKSPRRHMRILLPYSILIPDDDIALFVCDLQRGRRKDYEPTVEHYKELLGKHGCTNIKHIIPLNQVKTEYDQYELKRKLVGSYDHFLVDGKIAGHLSHLLGKQFYKKRKLPTSIRMQSKDLKHEIEYALKKTSMQLHSYGDTHIVQIGNTYMNVEEILENVLAVCNHLSKHYPGGWTNIRSLRIKTTRSVALPIYTTLRSKNSIKIPAVQPKRPKAYCDVTGELSTLYGGNMVTVTPEGEVTVKKEKGKIKNE
ncbi:PREDICTED: ribosomal L1 domain-containing protein 1-like [Dufourea novaeangliae]|uniref:ribosomal L1 domain-containing protein 1-like n=1 Tax=Dufourea novaeangliae TaxID=178035 RepID=UPI000767B535|nr:PREDICTED: ribosomal L1 domain-containing protein 1-like [Dufourea novaeangliae]